MEARRQAFGEHGGQAVSLFVLSAETAVGPVELAVMEYGATLVRCVVPDAKGRALDIALGYDTLRQYVEGTAFFGAIVGRYGNRIRDSVFSLGGETYRLAPNQGRNQLHGGPAGFDKVVWSGEALPDRPALRFRHVSPDGDMGFPGELTAFVEFEIDAQGGFTVRFEAVTTRSTLCNLVQHGYWNLAGHDSGPVSEHVALFGADFYTPVDAELLATGEILSVKGTPFDFTRPKQIGADIKALEGDAPLAVGDGGYDHNLVLRGEGAGLRDCARVFSPASGLGLSLKTTEPGLQFYTGGYLSAGVVGKGGARYGRYGGFTVETQKFPGSPHFSHFPSARLDPDDTYRHAMQFRFFHGERPDALEAVKT